MIRVLAIADIHWGAIPAKTEYENLQLIFYFMERMQSQIDLVVICGDYFDYRLSLNSKAAIYAVKWMNELVEKARETGVRAIRVIKGTEEHDNNQLDVFNTLESDDDYFRIIRECTVEETLPGIKCLYAPDETINWKEYEEINLDKFLTYPDIGFFHGSFDIVLPDIAIQMSEETSIRSIIYPYATMSSFIKGPMIAGHWHEAYDNVPLHYIGSYEAWEHGEENTKGFVYMQYNEEDSSYRIDRIPNPLAKQFRTIITETSLFKSMDDYARLVHDVKEIKENAPELMLRLLFRISDDNSLAEDGIAVVKREFVNDRSIKVVVKNLVKKREKEKKSKEVKQSTANASYVFDKNMSIAEKVQMFLLTEKGQTFDISTIQSYLSKYLPDGVK